MKTEYYQLVRVWNEEADPEGNLYLNGEEYITKSAQSFDIIIGFAAILTDLPLATVEEFFEKEQRLETHEYVLEIRKARFGS